jgi:hypothetical protein
MPSTTTLHLTLHILWHSALPLVRYLWNALAYEVSSELPMPTRSPRGPHDALCFPLSGPYRLASDTVHIQALRSPNRHRLATCVHSFRLPLVCPDIAAALAVKTFSVRLACNSLHCATTLSPQFHFSPSLESRDDGRRTTETCRRWGRA